MMSWITFLRTDANLSGFDETYGSYRLLHILVIYRLHFTCLLGYGRRDRKLLYGNSK